MRASLLIDSGRRRLRDAAAVFSAPGYEREQAEELLEFALGHAPRPTEEVPAAVRRRFEHAIERRAAGEPIPYITGYTVFRGLRMGIRPGMFVPRATTEFLAEQAARRVRRRPSAIAVDLATGIGPVAVSVAAAAPDARVFGTDINPRALAQARRNARALGLENVSFHRGSLFAPLPRAIRGEVSAITIHPPYVARGEVRELPPELRRFEPVDSLTDRSDDGLGLVRPLVTQSPEWLRPDGWLLIEIGAYLARAVRSVLMRAGYREVRSTEGPMRFTRVLVARPPA